MLGEAICFRSAFIYCAVRNYMLQIVSCTMQSYIIYYIGKEVFVMDGFAGQMYLGAFGAEMGKGPNFYLNGIGCTGPGGTKYGVESYYCRWLGCNLIILTVMTDS